LKEVESTWPKCGILGVRNVNTYGMSLMGLADQRNALLARVETYNALEGSEEQEGAEEVVSGHDVEGTS
jgi:hypothetical protein